jgi:hypothetical protein
MRRIGYVCLLAGVVTLAFLTAERCNRVVVAQEPKAQEPKADGDAKATDQEQISELLETVGMLGGLNLYQTYLNVGLIADGKSQGVYGDDDAKELLGSVLTPLETLTERFDKAGKITTSKEDKAAIARVSKAAGLLKTQGQHLVSFWNDGKESDGNRYEASRKLAYAEISDMIGLNKKLPSADGAK